MGWSPMQHMSWGGSGDDAGTGHGAHVVTAAGTAEAISATQYAKRVMIKAENSNTGLIGVGKSTVDISVTGADSTTFGYHLDADQETPWLICDGDDLANVFIDATVSGDGVTYIYEG